MLSNLNIRLWSYISKQTKIKSYSFELPIFNKCLTDFKIFLRGDTTEKFI